jgi:transposase
MEPFQRPSDDEIRAAYDEGKEAVVELFHRTIGQLAARMREKRTALGRAFEGRVQAHNRFVLTELLCQTDGLDETLERFNQEIEAPCRPFEAAVVLLDTIPGVARETAEIPRTRDTYLAAQYYRLAGRRGKKKDIRAVVHSILVIAYHLIQRKEPYRDLGGDYFDKRRPESTTKRLVKRLEKLGNQVSLAPLASPIAA